MTGAMYQDGEGLRKDAASIREQAANYRTKIERLYDEIHNTVSATDEGKAWFGPKAGEFVQAVENMRGDFETIAKTLESAADELESQANAWSKFEG